MFSDYFEKVLQHGVITIDGEFKIVKCHRYVITEYFKKFNENFLNLREEMLDNIQDKYLKKLGFVKYNKFNEHICLHIFNKINQKQLKCLAENLEEVYKYTIVDECKYNETFTFYTKKEMLDHLFILSS